MLATGEKLSKSETVLTISQDNLEYPSYGGRTTIKVSNEDWRIESVNFGNEVVTIKEGHYSYMSDDFSECYYAANWVWMAKIDGNLKVYVKPNIYFVPVGSNVNNPDLTWDVLPSVTRSCEITLTAEGAKTTIKITQDGSEDYSEFDIVLDKADVQFPSEGGSETVTASNSYFALGNLCFENFDFASFKSVTTPEEPEGMVKNWLRIVRTDNVIEITASPNKTGKDRKAVLTLSEHKKINIYQKGC